MTNLLARRLQHPAGKAGLLALAASLGLLAACARQGVIYHSYPYLAGTAIYVDHVAGSRLPTIIRGNPSNLDKADFDRIVRDDIYGANFGRPITFVPGPDRAPWPGYRVIMVFNGPAAGYSGLCSDEVPGGGGPAPDGRIELLAAFCSGDRPVTSLAGGIAELTDPNDPRLRAFLRHVSLTLFSRNNPDDRPDRGVNVPIP
ncbi:MAG: hypothetical protein ACOY3L_06635 [Pseudomonadota bacterium]